jgi:hypothetical protein
MRPKGALSSGDPEGHSRPMIESVRAARELWGRGPRAAERGTASTAAGRSAAPSSFWLRDDYYRKVVVPLQGLSNGPEDMVVSVPGAADDDDDRGRGGVLVAEVVRHRDQLLGDHRSLSVTTILGCGSGPIEPAAVATGSTQPSPG